MTTHTRTKTITVTKTRMQFIQLQVRIALRRSMTNIQEDTLKRVFDQGLAKKYIKQIDIYGIDISGLCRAHLKIQIDWYRHQVCIREGRDFITAPEKWMQTGAIEIDEMTRLFREFIDDQMLTTTWQIWFSDGIDYERARRELGTVPTTPPKWISKPEGLASSVSLADEMNIGFYAAT